MNFTLNDSSIDYTLTDQLEFSLSDRAIDYFLDAITAPTSRFRLLENFFPNDPDNLYRLLEDGNRRLLE